MESENQVDTTKQPGVKAEMKTSEGRRKLIRGALIGAPVLLALKSSPVLACNCNLPSGFSTSGNLSRHVGANCTKPANKPVYWQGQRVPSGKSSESSKSSKFSESSEFTRTGIATSTPFNSVFGGSDRRTFLEILNTGDNFASLAIAAYLNTKVPFGFVSGISTQDIVNMWNGRYKPRGNSNNWTLAEGENYLRYTMGLTLNP